MTETMSADQALAHAAEAGIHMMPIPTPFAVGRVNTYLIEDSPLTLVDSGPNSGRALDELQRQLAEHGYALADIELLIITHQHIDHLGLADIVVRHSGADVAAIEDLVYFTEHYNESQDMGDQFSRDVMLRNGMSEEVVNALASVVKAFRAWGSKSRVTRPLRQGQTLALRDRKFEVMHRPGHSPSDTIFWDEQRKILVAADHLIKHISSNPLVSRPLGPDPVAAADRPQALVTYIESLKKTRELPAEIVLSGHGEPITDHVALIDKRLAFHEKRADKLCEMIATQPRTAYDLAIELFGDIAVTQSYLTLSEVLGHTDILVNQGRVAEVETDGVVTFETV